MAPMQKWNFLNACIKRLGGKDVMNEIKKQHKKVPVRVMVLPMSMSVHEMQCGSLVTFACMVNSVMKKVDTTVFSI